MIQKIDHSLKTIKRTRSISSIMDHRLAANLVYQISPTNHRQKIPRSISALNKKSYLRNRIINENQLHRNLSRFQISWFKNLLEAEHSSMLRKWKFSPLSLFSFKSKPVLKIVVLRSKKKISLLILSISNWKGMSFYTKFRNSLIRLKSSEKSRRAKKDNSKIIVKKKPFWDRMRPKSRRYSTTTSQAKTFWSFQFYRI